MIEQLQAMAAACRRFDAGDRNARALPGLTEHDMANLAALMNMLGLLEGPRAAARLPAAAAAVETLLEAA